MSSGFQWVVAPDEELIPNVEDYAERMLVAVQAVATYWGQQNQDDARKNAPWEDRTGHARGGLFFAVDGFGLGTLTGTVTPEVSALGSLDAEVETVEGDENSLVVTLGHTMFYGKFLELDHGGRFAVIMSTIEGNLPNLEKMLNDVFR